MPKAILIAEKPSYMRDLKECYKKHKKDIPYDIDFLAQHGHAVELLNPSEMDEAYLKWDEALLPIEPEEMGGFKYRTIKGSEEIIKDAKAAVSSGEYDYVIHAGDPDQEGELLTRLLLSKVNNKLPVLRIWPDATTDEKLFLAYKDMKPDDEDFFENLYNAGLVRQHADWRFGMNGSRAVGARFITKEKAAVGRVMTAVQAMIVNRELEIRNFVEKTTYGVTANFKEGYSGQLFEMITVPDEKTGEEKEIEQLIYFETEEEALEKAESLEKNGSIVSITSKKKQEYAPPLYDLAGAQIDGAKLGFSAEKTLQIIQSLYEKHVVTYPRTDCTVLSATENFQGMFDAIEDVPGMKDATDVARDSLSQVVRMNKYVNDKELQKHGHSALVPTTERADYSSLSDDEIAIYEMITRRFLAIFQPPLIEKKTRIETKLGKDMLVTKGKVIIDPGYTAFLGTKSEETPLPELTEGQAVSVDTTETTEKKTTPPKRFTNGSIIQAMQKPTKYLYDKEVGEGIDDFHIGTSATRAAIIEKLKKYAFIKSKGGTLYPSEWSMYFIEKMKDIDITKVDMTGKWEHLLEQVRNGEISKEQAEDLMRKEVRRMVKDILNMEKYSFGDVNVNRKIVGTCPDCGKDIIASEKSIFCSGWKEGCTNSISKAYFDKMKSRITPEEAIKMFKGETIKKMLTSPKSGKQWEQELCLKEITDDEGKKKKQITFVEKDKKTDYTCPHCNEHKLEWDGLMLKCSCGYNLWAAPAHRQLSSEELDYIFEHKSSNGYLKNFQKKDGGTFEAKLILTTDPEDELKGSFEMKFKPKKNGKFKK